MGETILYLKLQHSLLQQYSGYCELFSHKIKFCMLCVCVCVCELCLFAALLHNFLPPVDGRRTGRRQETRSNCTVLPMTCNLQLLEQRARTHRQSCASVIFNQTQAQLELDLDSGAEAAAAGCKRSFRSRATTTQNQTGRERQNSCTTTATATTITTV